MTKKPIDGGVALKIDVKADIPPRAKQQGGGVLRSGRKGVQEQLATIGDDLPNSWKSS